jgi:hypothetical protein
VSRLSNLFLLSRHGFHANNQLDGGDGGGRMECINTQEYIMEQYVFVDGNGNINFEVTVTATNEREARKLAWATLTDEQKDACGFLDCVDVLPAKDAA